MTPRLRSAPGGELEGRGPVELALTGARVQATVSPSGVGDVLVWGSGHAGALRFEPPLPSDARVRITPNRIVYDWGEGRLAVAGLPRAPGGTVGPRGRVTFGPAGLALLAAGADRDEAARAVAGVLGAAAPGRELDAWQRELAEVLRLPDDELQGLFLHGLHAARSARKELPDGRAEAHLAIDTLTALRYGLADDARARRTLAAMRRRRETRHNRAQPYGDWGVMNVFPPYAPWVRRRGKSRFPYRYHDGADWPVWDGVYAEQRLRLGVGGWRYPLTRWWALALERGRATPFEYWSPPYGEGSPSNAWSSM
ncbi:MAG: hypothetical protein K0A98_05475, partial [Trueperaceae bacterium]|nr:hypothetical protein [Trueperaceae bacterium]